MSKKTRELMKKISGIDKEEKVFLQALWTFFLGLEEAIDKKDYKTGIDCVRASLRLSNELEELIKKNINLYEPSEAFKLGKKFLFYNSLLYELEKGLARETKALTFLVDIHDALSSITRIILGEEDEEN